MEMVVNGVSSRKVAQITEELCGKAFSKSTVSDLCQGLDPLVSAWNERSLAEQRYPFVLVDALVLKIREGGRVRARSALLAIGVNAAGYREILGLQLGDSESERSWMDYFVWLKGRGLTGVDLVVSDSHGGLVNAVGSSTRWARQRGAAPVSGRDVAALPDASVGQRQRCDAQGDAGGDAGGAAGGSAPPCAHTATHPAPESPW
jgi:transposase-like protein